MLTGRQFCEIYFPERSLDLSTNQSSIIVDMPFMNASGPEVLAQSNGYGQTHPDFATPVINGYPHQQTNGFVIDHKSHSMTNGHITQEEMDEGGKKLKRKPDLGTNELTGAKQPCLDKQQTLVSSGFVASYGGPSAASGSGNERVVSSYILPPPGVTPPKEFVDAFRKAYSNGLLGPKEAGGDQRAATSFHTWEMAERAYKDSWVSHHQVSATNGVYSNGAVDENLNKYHQDGGDVEMMDEDSETNNNNCGTAVTAAMQGFCWRGDSRRSLYYGALLPYCNDFY